jgi:hypothetical protein
MTLAEIKSRLRAMRKLIKARDFEAAHGAERRLLADVLGAIATNDTGNPWTDPAILASEALKATRMEFPRW